VGNLQQLRNFRRKAAATKYHWTAPWRTVACGGKRQCERAKGSKAALRRRCSEFARDGRRIAEIGIFRQVQRNFVQALLHTQTIFKKTIAPPHHQLCARANMPIKRVKTRILFIE
jgi:hypothetical protein